MKFVHGTSSLHSLHSAHMISFDNLNASKRSQVDSQFSYTIIG
jgi:hypothetical protein